MASPGAPDPAVGAVSSVHQRDAGGVTTIDAHYIKPGIASLQLMIERGRAAFFDTGTTRSLPHAIEALHKHGLAAADVDFVIPTHVHLDHAGGAGAMMQAFTNARLIIHPRGAEHMADPARLWAGTVGVYGEKMAAELYGEVIPVERRRMLIADDDWELDFYGRPLRFLHTPGHARHHFCVYDSTRGAIFAGDTLGISYRKFDGPNGPFVFPTTSPVQFEPGPLHRSIDRLMALDPKTVYLTHFGPIQPSARIADELHRQIDDFVSLADELYRPGGDNTGLERGIADYLLDRARRHGVPLAEDRLRDGLRMDARLNADGIAVWKARSRKTAHNK